MEGYGVYQALEINTPEQSLKIRTLLQMIVPGGDTDLFQNCKLTLLKWLLLRKNQPQDLLNVLGVHGLLI